MKLNKMKTLKILALLMITSTVVLCVKLDFYLFEVDPVESVNVDYHGLSVYSGNNPPDWVDESIVERNIYLTIPEGKIIDTTELSNYNEYIHGVFLPAPTLCPSDTCPLIDNPVTFLYTHGNSGNLYRYWYRAISLWCTGANVFIFTYRGYGLSKGESTRSNVKEDAFIAAQYLRKRSDVDTSRIIVYGYSMGGIPAAYLVGSSSLKNRFAGVILESALDSPEDIVNISTGIKFPDGFFFDDSPFNGPQFIKGVTIPVLQMHGGEDERIIIEQAYSYYDVLKNNNNYTHYIGKTSEKSEAWMIKAGHRNVTNWVFKAEKHIPDYWDDPKNPNNCCTHPNEFLEEESESFLKDIGGTTAQAIFKSSEDYRNLIVDWILSF